MPTDTCFYCELLEAESLESFRTVYVAPIGGSRWKVRVCRDKVACNERASLTQKYPVLRKVGR